MKKLSKFLVALIVTFMAAFSLTACGKNNVTRATVSGLDLAVAKGETLDTSNVVVTAIYKNGDTKDFSGEDLTFGAINTEELGTKDLTITINPVDYSFTVQIKVVATGADVNTISQLESELIKEFKANRTATGEYEDFVHDDKPLRAGTQNPFHFRLKAAGVAADGETLLPDVRNVRTSVKVELKDGSSYTELTGDTLANYVSVETINAVLDFTDAAIGKTFRITVAAANADADYEESNYTFTQEVDVIKGFNVYDIDDMSVYDNINVKGVANDVRGSWIVDSDRGWTDNHNRVKAKYGLTNFDDIDVLLLQDDIVITQSNIRQDALWDSADNDFGTIQAVTDQTLAGTPHNSDNRGIFHRRINIGEQFKVIGNYFAIDISQLPKMVAYDDEDYINYEAGRSMTGYFSLFRTESARTANDKSALQFATSEHNTSIEYDTVSFIGNGQMSADPRNSGSVLLMKHDEVNFKGYNTIANNFYTTYYFALGNPKNPNDGQYEVRDCKAFNSFTSSIYIWGGENINLINSTFKNSGGPAILADSFAWADNRANDYDGDEACDAYRVTGQDIYPTINVINTELVALASGQEPWYNHYNAGEAVGLMALLGDCLTGAQAFGANGSPYTNTGKTIVADVKGENNTPRINVQCAIFGDGITLNDKPISGIINVYDSEEDFINKTSTNHSLNLKNYISADVVSKGAPVFECTETGSFRTSPLGESGLVQDGIVFSAHVMTQFFNGLYAGLYSGLDSAHMIGTESWQFNFPAPTGSMSVENILGYFNTALTILEQNKYNPDPEAAAANAANFEPLVDGLYAGGAAKYSPVANWNELCEINNQVERVAAKATALKQALARAAATCDDEWTGEHVNLYLPGRFGYMGIMLGLYDQPAAQ